MARFDVHRMARVAGYGLDIQADFLSRLDTRPMVPLLFAQDAPRPAVHLDPSFRVQDDEVVVMTQFMAAVHRSAIGAFAGNLSGHHYEIVGAIDFLTQGF